jgi:hypothetical protein
MARDIEAILRNGERDAKRIVIDCLDRPGNDDGYAVKVTTKSGKVCEHFFEGEEETLKFLKEAL